MGMPMFERWSIRGQILALVALLILPIIVLFVHNAVERVETRRLESEQIVESLATLAAEQMALLWVSTRDALNVLREFPPVRRLGPDSCAPIGSVLDFRANLYANAVLFDLDGSLVCAAVGERQIGALNVADSPWYRAARRKMDLSVSTPFVDPLTGARVVMFSLPVRDADGDVVGLFGLPVNLDDLARRFARLPVPRQAVITGIGPHGHVVFRTRNPSIWIGEDVRDTPIFQRPPVADGEAFEAVGLDGVARVYAERLVTGPGWRVHVGVPVDAVVAPVRRQILVSGGVALLGTLLATVFGLAMAAHVLGPLQRFVAQVRRGAEPDALIASSRHGPPEIRHLATQLAETLGAKADAERRHRLLARMFENSREAMFITDRDNRILAVNRAFEDVTGYTEAEARGQDPRLLRSGRHDRRFYQALWSALDQVGAWQGEIWNRRKSGDVFPALLTLGQVEEGSRNPDGAHFVATMADISQQKRTEAELEYLAHHDALTALPNRTLFLDRLGQALARNRRHPESRIAVAILDLDRFKNINDTLGHPAGDALLVQVAKRLRACLRAADTIARIGGDEFTIILEDLAAPENVLPTLEHIIESLREPFMLDGRPVTVSLSIGISLCPDNSEDATELVSFADAAMYRAKAEGTRYAFYSRGLTEEAAHRLALEQDLAHAIEHDGFHLVYQPLYSVGSDTVIGCEALIRWNHPQRGPVSPQEFIPVAEQIGLITPITQWVFEEVFRQYVAWREQRLTPSRISINVSGRSLDSPILMDCVRRARTEIGIPAGVLELEITEGSLMQHPEAARERIDDLRRLGARIAIDDFGTGYSSLSYIRNLAADVLKMDQSFVRHIESDTGNQGIARAVIAMGQALRMEVLAEGIEAEDERRWLAGAGCDLMQGYLFSVPLPGHEFLSLWQASGRR
jgi:diguanylate cyclase (GGDEF)-like protein/PAS domain S-box-containing protein